MHVNRNSIRQDFIASFDGLKSAIDSVTSITLPELCELLKAQIEIKEIRDQWSARIVLPAYAWMVSVEATTGKEMKSSLTGAYATHYAPTQEAVNKLVAQELSHRLMIFFPGTSVRRELRLPEVTATL